MLEFTPAAIRQGGVPVPHLCIWKELGELLDPRAKNLVGQLPRRANEQLVSLLKLGSVFNQRFSLTAIPLGVCPQFGFKLTFESGQVRHDVSSAENDSCLNRK
jgi:hypothetical protein